MIKLIPLLLLFILFKNSLSVAQSSKNIGIDYNHDKKRIVSIEVMDLIRKDLKDYKELKKEYALLKVKHDSLSESFFEISKEIDLYLMRINQLQLRIAKLEKENDIMDNEVEKSLARAKSYQEIIKRRDREIIKYKRYQPLAYLKLGELIVVQGIFLGVIIGVLHVSK